MLGYDPVQLYGEVHLPWLTKGGVDVKGGRFYALTGYEDGRAPARPDSMPPEAAHTPGRGPVGSPGRSAAAPNRLGSRGPAAARPAGSRRP